MRTSISVQAEIKLINQNPEIEEKMCISRGQGVMVKSVGNFRESSRISRGGHDKN